MEIAWIPGRSTIRQEERNHSLRECAAFTQGKGTMADQPRHEVLPVNETELAFVSQGTGDAVVFVHGSVNDYRSWRSQTTFFAGSYRAVAYSRRYQWHNPLPADGASYAIDQHVVDLIALIETLERAPVRLVGSSYGAMTSLIAAIARPELVRSLVLGEPPLLPW